MKKGYWVSLYFKIDNQENIKKYSELATPIIKSYGGIPLVRGGKHETFNGDDFDRIKDEEIKKLESKNIIVEYLEHRMNSSLDLVKGDISKTSIFIACHIDNIRLIDNIQI